MSGCSERFPAARAADFEADFAAGAASAGAVSYTHLFADFFLDQANRELDKRIVGFDAAAAAALAAYGWPGNLRQLKNAVMSATLLAAGEYITCRDLPGEITEEMCIRDSDKPSYVSYERASTFDAAEFPSRAVVYPCLLYTSPP